jgi:hypothetical protein
MEDEDKMEKNIDEYKANYYRKKAKKKDIGKGRCAVGRQRYAWRRRQNTVQLSQSFP